MVQLRVTKVILVLTAIFVVNFVISPASGIWASEPGSFEDDTPQHNKDVLEPLPGDEIQSFQGKTQEELIEDEKAKKYAALVKKYADVVPDTIGLLNEGHERIMLHPKKEYVMIVGRAGTGKSTMALLLTGNNSKLIAVEENDEFYIKEEEPDVLRIGTDTAVSHTIFPEAHIDNDTGVVYYDCPGFADSRKGPHIEIANAMFMKKLADHAHKLKIIVAVNHFSLKRTADRNDFKDTIEGVTKLLLNMKKYVPGVGMVVTKVDSKKSDEQVIQNIAKFLALFKEKLEVITDDEKLEARMDLLNGLLLQNETGEYPRISIFRKPDQEGPLSENEDIQKNKADLKHMVSQLQYVNNSKNDIGYVISENVLLVTRDVHDTIESQVTESVQQWATSFEEHFENQVSELQNQFLNCPNCSAQDEIQELKHNWGIILDFVRNNHNLNSLEDDILSPMRETDPLIEETLVTKLSYDAKTLNFLAEVDKSINGSDWSKLKLVFERTGWKIKDLLKDIHGSTVSQADGLFKEWCNQFEDHVKKQLKKLLDTEKGFRKEQDVNAAKQNLNIMRQLMDPRNTDGKADFDHYFQLLQQSDLPAHQGQTKLMGIIEFLQLLEELDEEMFPSPSLSKVMETLSKTENSLKIFLSTGEDFYLKGKAKIATTLDHLTTSLRKHYANQFSSNDYSSWANMKTAVESDLNGVKMSRESDGSTPIRVDLHQAWHLAKEGLKYLKIYEPVNDTAAKIDAIIEVMQLGKILVEKLPAEPDINAIHIWQPLENFLTGFLQTMAEGPTGRYDRKKQELVIRGNMISMKDILNRLRGEWSGKRPLKSLVITAKHTVFMDASLVGSQINPNGLNLVILSPKWWVSEPHINLNGISGGTPGSWNKSPGQSGAPGLPGGNAGNFFGAWMKFSGQELKVTVDGGQGGPGEDGQPGADGADGPMAAVSGGKKSQEECVGSQEKVFGSIVKDTVIIRSPYYGFDCKCDMHGWVKFYGGNGQPGLPGGDGGKGGLGGYGGRVFLLDASSQTGPEEHSGSQGQTGTGGQGGQGGKGGRKGATKWYSIFTERTSTYIGLCVLSFGIRCGYEDDCSYYDETILPSDTYERNGTDGKPDSFSSGMKYPKLKPSTFTLNENSRHIKSLRAAAMRMENSLVTKLVYQPHLLNFLQKAEMSLN